MHAVLLRQRGEYRQQVAILLRGLFELRAAPSPNVWVRCSLALTDSYGIYDEIGYDWRAGKVALALASVTSDPHYLELARGELKRYQKSWLGSAWCPLNFGTELSRHGARIRRRKAARSALAHVGRRQSGERGLAGDDRSELRQRIQLCALGGAEERAIR
jgi:hypothetical protein